jgi:hypothetical protein
MRTVSVPVVYDPYNEETCRNPKGSNDLPAVAASEADVALHRL